MVPVYTVFTLSIKTRIKTCRRYQHVVILLYLRYPLKQGLRPTVTIIHSNIYKVFTLSIKTRIKTRLTFALRLLYGVFTLSIKTRIKTELLQ